MAELPPSALAAEVAQLDAAVEDMRRRLSLDLVITAAGLVVVYTYVLMRGRA